jgi:glycerate-2-kinase
VNAGSDNVGEARDHGKRLVQRLIEMRDGRAVATSAPVCLLAGGETTVHLTPTTKFRKGGRNQEVILGAVAANPAPRLWKNIALISGGTDGEDGPTDAAGAFADEELLRSMVQQNLQPTAFLNINNSYPFFERLGGLVITGPTHTNVMDLAVGLIYP